MQDVRVCRMEHARDLPLPSYETAGAAGMDLRAAVEGDLTLKPGEYVAVPTGLRIALEEGYEAQVRPRSGLAAKHGVTVLNAPGTVDADYRGEIKVILINHGALAYPIKRGDRVAQLVIAPAKQANLLEVGPEEFQAMTTERGAKGFGSTGK